MEVAVGVHKDTFCLTGLAGFDVTSVWGRPCRSPLIHLSEAKRLFYPDALLRFRVKYNDHSKRGGCSKLPEFQIVSDFKPTGDQPEAIDKLVDGVNRGLRQQTLLGVTGIGKTFTLACVIERLQRHAIWSGPTHIAAPTPPAAI